MTKGRTRKLLKEYMKTTSYTEGAIYKVDPWTLCEHFLKWLEDNQYITLGGPEC